MFFRPDFGLPNEQITAHPQMDQKAESMLLPFSSASGAIVTGSTISKRRELKDEVFGAAGNILDRLAFDLLFEFPRRG
jgi:hypothetical protein